ncbi:hypothetical protein YC2023_099552 [Brassica napus]
MTLTWGRATRKSKRKKTPTRTRIPIEDHRRFNLESPGLLLMDAYVLIELRGPGVKPERQSIWYDIGRTPFFCARCAFGYNSMKRCVEVAEKGHVKPANYLDSHQKILIGVASTGEEDDTEDEENKDDDCEEGAEAENQVVPWDAAQFIIFRYQRNRRFVRQRNLVIKLFIGVQVSQAEAKENPLGDAEEYFYNTSQKQA